MHNFAQISGDVKASNVFSGNSYVAVLRAACCDLIIVHFFVKNCKFTYYFVGNSIIWWRNSTFGELPDGEASWTCCMFSATNHALYADAIATDHVKLQ